MTTTTTETPSGVVLALTLLLLVTVGFPIAYWLALVWEVFGRTGVRSDQEDEDVAVTRDKKE